MSENHADRSSRLETRATLRRRTFLAGIGGAVAAGLPDGTAMGRAWAAEDAAGPSTLTFPELSHGLDETHHVAEGFDATVLLRWGDPLVDGLSAWDPTALAAADQERRFGYNCDFTAYFPLPLGSQNSDRGLLCVNHEYTTSNLMFDGVPDAMPYAVTEDQAAVEMAAHGHAVVEVRRDENGTWAAVTDSPYNRRITATTSMRLSGPAAGHVRLRTSADPTGRAVFGTVNNCAGGQTPWGTCLIAEENIHYYFGGDPNKTAEADNHLAMGISKELRYQWFEYHNRFHVEKEPHEPNRFGWVVEYDPYDARSEPVKRTALGRFKHEGATTAVAPDGRVAVYSGDDEVFQFIYRFVSARPLDVADRSANTELLDEGTLYAARFDEDGTLTWLPLIWGEGPLTPENDFSDQGDVLIETRRAAALMGATPMDRPEDVETNPVTGRVYVTLTKNWNRTDEMTDAANPRGRNGPGHILEFIPPSGLVGAADHAAATFTWDVFILAGDPAQDRWQTLYHPETSANGWFANPDNLAFDPAGRLWISTDGADGFGTADGIWATDTTGPGRALTRHFFRCPRGAEMTGLTFTPDGETLFCSVQHPGQADGASYDSPATRWPDFKDGVPPRPSVVAVTRRSKGPIS